MHPINYVENSTRENGFIYRYNYKHRMRIDWSHGMSLKVFKEVGYQIELLIFPTLCLIKKIIYNEYNVDNFASPLDHLIS